MNTGSRILLKKENDDILFAMFHELLEFLTMPYTDLTWQFVSTFRCQQEHCFMRLKLKVKFTWSHRYTDRMFRKMLLIFGMFTKMHIILIYIYATAYSILNIRKYTKKWWPSNSWIESFPYMSWKTNDKLKSKIV